MVLKRNIVEGEGEGAELTFQGSKRRLSSSNGARDVMPWFSAEELASKLEPRLRDVVREEIQHALQNFFGSSSRFSLKPVGAFEAATLQLQFQTKLPSELFTGSRIESDDSCAVKLVLIDVHSKEIVTSGPLSSAKVQLLALNGDFCNDDQEDWSEEEFNAKVLSQREGKRPLVAGDVVVTLKEGVACLGDVYFTDNSSWIRCRKFRLGAKVANASAGLRIREARSDAFIVKDHRGESYQKHHPPSLGNEVWRLEKIAKEGAFHKRMQQHRVFTVKDFLQLYVTNPSSLRSILGGGMSNKTFDLIIKHALNCVLDDKLYVFHYNVNGIGLVFNSILKVVGATLDGHNYLALGKLSASHLHVVEVTKQQFYKEIANLVPIDESSLFGLPMPLTSLHAELFGSSSLGSREVFIPVPYQGQLQKQRAFSSMALSSPLSCQEEDENRYLKVSMAQSSPSMYVSSPAIRNSFIMRDVCEGLFGEGCSSAQSRTPESGLFTGHITTDDDFLPDPSLLQGEGFCIAPSSHTFGIVSVDFKNPFSRNGSPKVRWCKIRAAIKWASVRRDVAARKMAELCPYGIYPDMFGDRLTFDY